MYKWTERQTNGRTDGRTDMYQFDKHTTYLNTCVTKET